MISVIRKRIENEMTPIVAFGLIALACISAFMVVSKVGDTAKSLQNEVQTAQMDLITLQNLQGNNVWSQRLEKSIAELKKVNSKTWQGSSPGVVSAYLEETLIQMLNKMEADRVLINVDPNPQQLNDVTIISFNIRGQLPSHLAVVDLIALIEGHNQNIWLNDSAMSFNANGKATFSTTGFIPARISESVKDDNE